MSKRCRRETTPRDEREYAIMAGDGSFSDCRIGFDEAIKMRDSLNKNGEFPPYKMFRVEPGTILIDAS